VEKWVKEMRRRYWEGMLRGKDEWVRGNEEERAGQEEERAG
jgi:hypothetical protein